jgi:hypothetical protein
MLIWINGKPAGKGPGAGVVTAPSPTTAAVLPATPAAPQASTPAATTPSSQPDPAPTAPASSPTATAPVVVLNNSTIRGLAARVADELASRGWHIETVGNMQGRLPNTTVYFAPGERAAAVHLAREFPSIRRIAAAASGHLDSHGHDLTLIVTRGWA